MTLQRSTQNERHDLYFRSADRLRAAGCANALSREGLSVVMSCDREALLDHYVEMTLQEVRKSTPDCLVEAYFPESTESLMARFNEILASSSIQDALKPGSVDTPLRVWIIHDAPGVPTQELQLLARLIHNFPGAKVRALLLSTQRGSDDGLNVFGRRVLRWDIELPTATQVQAALENARFEGRERSVRQLLAVAGLLTSPSVSATDQKIAEQALSFGRSNEARVDISGEEDAPKAISAKPTWRDHVFAACKQRFPRLNVKLLKRFSSVRWPQVNLRKPSDRLQGAMVVGLALMALSTLLTFWMQPESFKSSTSASTKAARSNTVVPTAHANAMRPVAARMDAL